MSSAVNKSSKRFVPKIGARGSSIRAPVRRSTRTSFSAPDRADSSTAQTPAQENETQNSGTPSSIDQGAKSRAESLGLFTEDLSKDSGSAIDDTYEDILQSEKTATSPKSSHDIEPLVPESALESTESRHLSDGIAQSTQSTLVESTEHGQKRKSVHFELGTKLTEPESTEENQPDTTQLNITPSLDGTQVAKSEQQSTPQPLRSDQPTTLLSPSVVEHTEERLPIENVKKQPEQSATRQRPPPPVQPPKQPIRLSNLNAPRKPAVTLKRPLSRPGSSSNSTRSTAANNVSRLAKATPRPEAPPGCQIIEPEDLQDLKREERRRREAWETAQMKLMRELFVEKEQKRLMDEESYDDTSAARVAHASSEAMTFNALKQAVMSELKAYKEKMEKEKEAQSKEKGSSQSGSAASAAADTAASILEPGGNPPLKQLINVEKFRMSDLCKDIPIGTPNEKFDDYENARVQRRRDRLLLLRAKNWKRNALKREPSESEKALLETVYAKFKNERLARSDKIKEESERKLKSLDDSARGGPAAAPTLEIGQDGQIRIEHTQVDRHLHNRSNHNDSGQNKVEVDETQKTINSYSFSTKERPERWSKEETQKFYEALSAWGTDFNLIAHLFPTRTRHQIKTKFKYEERRHSIKVQMYLVHRRKANVNSYAEVSDQQIEDVKDIEEALERVRDEHEERMKIEQSAREQARNEDQEKLENHDSPKRRSRDTNNSAPKRERLK